MALALDHSELMIASESPLHEDVGRFLLLLMQVLSIPGRDQASAAEDVTGKNDSLVIHAYRMCSVPMKAILQKHINALRSSCQQLATAIDDDSEEWSGDIRDTLSKGYAAVKSLLSYYENMADDLDNGLVLRLHGHLVEVIRILDSNSTDYVDVLDDTVGEFTTNSHSCRA